MVGLYSVLTNREPKGHLVQYHHSQVEALESRKIIIKIKDDMIIQILNIPGLVKSKIKKKKEIMQGLIQGYMGFKYLLKGI